MHIQTPHLHILTLSHTNTLNHYHFILKPKKKKKLNTQLTPLQTFKSCYQKYKEQYQTKPNQKKKKRSHDIHTHKKT